MQRLPPTQLQRSVTIQTILGKPGEAMMSSYHVCLRGLSLRGLLQITAPNVCGESASVCCLDQRSLGVGAPAVSNQSNPNLCRVCACGTYDAPTRKSRRGCELVWVQQGELQFLAGIEGSQLANLSRLIARGNAALHSALLL